MKKLAQLGIALALPFMVTGCGGGADGAIKEQISLMNEMAGVLEGVTDKASFEAAQAKMKKLEDRGKELGKKLEDMKLSDQEKKNLEEKYKGQAEQAAKRLTAAMTNAMTKGMGGAPGFPGVPGIPGLPGK
jgi:hypothetical protein